MAVNEKIVCKLNIGDSLKEVSLSSLEWGIVTQVDGKKTIGEIASNLAMTLDEALKIFENLIQKGLIQVSHEEEGGAANISAETVARVKEKLLSYVGPVAQFLFDDVLENLHLDAAAIPKTRFAEFVEQLSEEITDEKKKVDFQKEMLQLMREL